MFLKGNLTSHVYLLIILLHVGKLHVSSVIISATVKTFRLKKGSILPVLVFQSQLFLTFKPLNMTDWTEMVKWFTDLFLICKFVAPMFQILCKECRHSSRDWHWHTFFRFVFLWITFIKVSGKWSCFFIFLVSNLFVIKTFLSVVNCSSSK